MLPGPGPDLPEQAAVQPRPPQIMKQAGDLILRDPGRRMAKMKRNGRAHPGRAERMRAVIAAENSSRLAGIGIVVETEEFSGQGEGDEERGGIHIATDDNRGMARNHLRGLSGTAIERALPDEPLDQTKNLTSWE